MFKKSNPQCWEPRDKDEFWIGLIPSSQSQASRLIPLSLPENNTLDKMINDGLSRKHTLYSHILQGHPWFFFFTRGKRVSNLWPCFDDQRLKVIITIENNYSLLLKMEMVDSLLDKDTGKSSSCIIEMSLNQSMVVIRGKIYWCLLPPPQYIHTYIWIQTLEMLPSHHQ